ncbi:alpha/beta-hydrolase [Marasmius fiardii PR-910]|nr:alpha/beta-hydrolase [Marasmius fiardii PR-910]
MAPPELLTAKVLDYDFAYYDSGAPPNPDHKTIVLVHGNTYHAGTFLSLFPGAAAHNFRVILVNRRLYPGTTPYTEEEVNAVVNGTYEQRVQALNKDGELLALFTDAMIQKYSLKRVVVVAWSQGTGFLNPIIDAIHRLDEGPRNRLAAEVISIVHWDPPSIMMGLQDPPTGGWTPLYDESLTLEQRGQAFAQWLSTYFPHPDLASRDPKTLLYKCEKPTKPLSFSTTSFEDLLTMVDFSANARGDLAMGEPYFKSVMYDRLQKALLSVDTRKAWKNAKFNIIYGDESPWNVQWSIWSIEKLIKEANDPALELQFKVMHGANHFSMRDLPDLVLSTIAKCV